jgi:hypothetical protein
MRSAFGACVLLGVAAATAHADLTGSWRVGFPVPPFPTSEFCRFDMVEAPDGQIEGWLGICGIGTDGLLSGRVDASGMLSLRIVAPDDAGCEAYGISATVAPSGDAIDGTYQCDFPLPGLSGPVTFTRCDPETPGSCPEVSGASLPPRLHEVRSCAPEPTPTCLGSPGARAKVRAKRESGGRRYDFRFTLPDATGVTPMGLGDPTTVRDYVACIYHTVGGSPVLAAMEPAWAGTFCDCWTVDSNQVLYRNPRYRNDFGTRGKLARVKVLIRPSGASSIRVKGRATTATPPPIASLQLPVVVQLLAGDDLCVGATFTTAITLTSDLLRATGGQ